MRYGWRGGKIRSKVGNDAGEMEFLILPIDKTVELQPRVCFSAELFEPGDDRGKGYRAFSHIPLITTIYYPEEGQRPLRRPPSARCRLSRPDFWVKLDQIASR